MATVKASVKRIVNLGRYENITVELGAELEVDDEPGAEDRNASAARAATALYRALEVELAPLVAEAEARRVPDRR